jgi:hypothetical protein
VRIRAVIALVTIAPLISAPIAAQAQETAKVAPTWIAPRRIDLSTSQAIAVTHTSMLAPFAPTPKPQPVLSDTAKTWIIIGSIIGGILIVAGVIVLAKPGKSPPKP